MTPTVIRIEAESQGVPEERFRAVAGSRKSVGRTAGEALDALLASEKGAGIESSAILIQRFVPDAYFTLAQYDRLQHLLGHRESLSEAESAELDVLIDAELEATIARAEGLNQTNHRVPSS
jgi:hypothetical protein